MRPVVPKSRSAMKAKLARLDRAISYTLRWLNKTMREREKAKLDAERKQVRASIKKYTGLGVGGSARRRTLRSPGSSPGAPTN